MSLDSSRNSTLDAVDVLVPAGAIPGRAIKRKRKQKCASKPKYHPRTGSEASTRLEMSLRRVVKESVAQWSKKVDKLVLHEGLTGEQVSQMIYRPMSFEGEPADEHEIVGCYPDGGILFLRGVPICAFEAKRQKDSGNAIERWFKNYNIVSQLRVSTKVAFVTFMTGAGATEWGIMPKKISSALMGQGVRFNHVYARGISVLGSETPFEDVVLRKIVDRVIKLSLNASVGQHISEFY